MLRVWLLALLSLGIIGAFAWLSDFVTMQGERTIYTVNCVSGTWQGARCTGNLEPGDRHRFRALKVHSEVLFWTVNSKEPSGKFTDCNIKDGRNWTCKPAADTARALTHEMSLGKPVRHPASTTQPAFHSVPKWRWLLLTYGVSLGSEASD